jgi:rhamnose transport system permease protein
VVNAVNNEKKNKIQSPWVRQIGLVLFIIVISVAIQFRNPKYLTTSNLYDLMTNTAVSAILVIGMMLVIVTRGIDLSIGSTMAFAGMLTAMTVEYYRPLNPIVALLMGLVIGLICGSIIGLVIVRFRVAPIIATLGFMNVYRGLTYIVANSKWVGANQMSTSFLNIGTGKVLGINNFIWITVIFYAVSYYFLNFTRFGRQIFAVGSNPDSATVSGIKVNRVIFSVYAYMGALAGLTGVMWVSKYASAQGGTALGTELKIIAACVLGGVSLTGGVGTLSGIFLGALLLGILNNAIPLLNVSPFWEDAIQGAIILIAVVANVAFKRNVEKNALARRKI